MKSLKNRGIQVIGLASVGLACAVSAFTPACAETPTRECRVGADCATGVCGDDGLCVREGTPGTDSGVAADAPISTDGEASDGPTGDSSMGGCVPNKDGTITTVEVPIAAGLHATYKIGTNENVSTAGVTTGDAGGKRTWDFSGALASDQMVIVETQSLKGKWYETKFPGATYASKLSVSADTLGVFETSPGALLLRGVVSPTESSSGTNLTYTPSVSVLKFPLTKGSTWTTHAVASGTAAGVDLAFFPTTEDYDSKVDAEGTLITPLGTFDVLRVAIVLTRKVTTGVVVTPTVVRSFAFVTECYGTVATVTSKDNEANEEFTTAKEIRRIAP
jgi:hypothetical protein